MHEGELQKRGYNAKTEEDPPVALDVLHAGTNGDSDCLAEWNAEAVCPDTPPTNRSGSQLSYVKWAYNSRPTHSDAKDKTTSDELAERETRCDDDSTGGKEQVSDQ
jgi:hypothetical protein